MLDDGVHPYHINEDGLMDDPHELRLVAHGLWTVLMDMLMQQDGARALIAAYGPVKANLLGASFAAVHSLVCEDCARQEREEERAEFTPIIEHVPQKGEIDTWLRIQSQLYAGHPLQN